MVDTPRYGIHPCAPLAPRCKSVLVAWSLEPFARHTQTVNLYAPLTLPVGQARGKHCPQVWSGGQLVGPRYTPCLPYACVLFAHSMSSQRLVSNLRACARAQSPRAAHGLHAHTACPLESWTPPQERRGLCQAPDTRMWLNAQQVEDETSSVFARKHTPVWKDGPSIVQGCYWGPSGGGV